LINFGNFFIVVFIAPVSQRTSNKFQITSKLINSVFIVIFLLTCLGAPV